MYVEASLVIQPPEPQPESPTTPPPEPQPSPEPAATECHDESARPLRYSGLPRAITSKTAPRAALKRRLENSSRREFGVVVALAVVVFIANLATAYGMTSSLSNNLTYYVLNHPLPYWVHGPVFVYVMQTIFFRLLAGALFGIDTAIDTMDGAKKDQ